VVRFLAAEEEFSDLQSVQISFGAHPINKSMVTAIIFIRVKRTMAEIRREAGRVGLVLNPDKTKYMKFSASPS
jgi:hypothetical protein